MGRLYFCPVYKTYMRHWDYSYMCGRCDLWHHMFTKEPQRSNHTGHKMHTGLWQETIKSDMLRYQKTKFLIWFYFLIKALTLHLKTFSSEFFFLNSWCHVEKYKMYKLYTQFCPAGNHTGTLKVTQSVNKSHGLYMYNKHCVCIVGQIFALLTLNLLRPC